MVEKIHFVLVRAKRDVKMMFNTFEFKGFFGCYSKCGYRLEQTDKWTVLIVSELDDNPGTSITNAVEILFPQICEKLNLDPEKLVWVEHYSETPVYVEIWDVVTMDFEDNKPKLMSPKWERISTDDVRKICSGINPLDNEILVKRKLNVNRSSRETESREIKPSFVASD
jgi:hypothetical protein